MSDIDKSTEQRQPIRLGYTCADLITAYEGICIARHERLGDGTLIELQAPMDQTSGTIPEAQWFPEGRLTVVAVPAENAAKIESGQQNR